MNVQFFAPLYPSQMKRIEKVAPIEPGGITITPSTNQSEILPNQNINNEFLMP